MDKEWLETTLGKHISVEVDVTGYYPVGIIEAAGTIAQAHEEDKWDAVLTLGNCWADIEDGHIAEIDRLEEEIAQRTAQVAVMAEALGTCEELLGDLLREPMHQSDAETCRGVVTAIEQALQDTPTVLWRGTGESRVGPDVGAGPYMIIGSQDFELRVMGEEPSEGQIVDVIVLAKEQECLPKGGHPEKSEQEESDDTG